MTGCATTDCVAAHTDRVTTSLVGPTDGHPGEPIRITTTVLSVSGGGDVNVYPDTATATVTAGNVTITGGN
jgi:hypothetical protein